MELPSRPHAALLASPGMGHLIPVLELGNRLVDHHGFDVTVFVVVTEASAAENQLLKPAQSRSNRLNVVFLPPVDITGLVDPAASILTQLAEMMRESLPILRSTITAMKFRPTVLIVDMFGTESLVIAEEFGMRKYVYITSNAWFLALTIHTPNLGKEVEGEPLEIPGCRPVRHQDILDPILNRKDQMYVEYVRMGFEIPLTDGILVNTWEDLEPTTLNALRDNRILRQAAKVPIYPVGPLVRQARTPLLRSDMVEWLDMQPTGSVVYVSFGSGGTLSAKQTIELAWGLDFSQQRFIWVLRPPTENDASGTLFTLGKKRDGPLDFLPDGFLTRTQKVGLVVPMWAPQAEIMNHPSIGGFLSHCGWNSTLESIVNGVPMIAWPLYAEQKMNATMLTEELRVAVRSDLPSNEVVDRVEIEMMVRRIMEDKKGSAVRARVKELKYSAEKALSKGGSSDNSLSQVAKDCEMSMPYRKAKVQRANGA